MHRRCHQLSHPQFEAFTAGRYLTMRNMWLERARSKKESLDLDGPSVKFYVEMAYAAHRSYLRAMTIAIMAREAEELA